MFSQQDGMIGEAFSWLLQSEDLAPLQKAAANLILASLETQGSEYDMGRAGGQLHPSAFRRITNMITLQRVVFDKAKSAYSALSKWVPLEEEHLHNKML